MSTEAETTPAQYRAELARVRGLLRDAMKGDFVREQCARVCDNQALMLAAAGDQQGAAAARLCASVLRALTPPIAPLPSPVCPAPTEGTW